MASSVIEIPPRKMARVAGALYLAFIVTFASSTFMQHGPTDLAATGWVSHAGYPLELASALLFLMSAWALYALLRPVNHDLALLFLLLNAAGVAIECVNMQLRFCATFLISGAAGLKGFSPEQLQAIAVLLFRIGGRGDLVEALFYGVWLFPLGYLVIKSGFIPKIIGILLIMDGASLMICLVQMWFFPEYKKLTYPLYPIMLIAESALALWLLIKAVPEQTAEGDSQPAA